VYSWLPVPHCLLKAVPLSFNLFEILASLTCKVYNWSSLPCYDVDVDDDVVCGQVSEIIDMFCSVVI